MGQQFEIEDYDDGELETGVTPATPVQPEEPQQLPPQMQQPMQQYQQPQPQYYEQPPMPPRRPGKLKVFGQLFWYYKKTAIPLTLLILLGILLAIPATRYPLVGMVLRRHFAVELVDAKTGRPISGATVRLGDKEAQTDAKGKAQLSVRVGPKVMTIEKKYYQTTEMQTFVAINVQKQPQEVSLAATGRQVPLTVVDKVSGKPVVDATIKVLDTSASTDKDGKAFIVLPTTQNMRSAKIGAKNYNDGTFTIAVTDSTVAQNTLKLTPSGRAVFLSNADGSIDIISANFDGSGRKTLLQGTGNEDALTQLFVSPNLKHAALFAKRDAGATPRLHIVDTATGSVKSMDNALATFVPVGWAGDHFIYTDERNDLQQWQAGKSELKSYSPADADVTTLDKSAGEGTNAEDYMAEQITAPVITGGNILYGKVWSAGFKTDGLANHNNVISRVQPDGKGRQTLRSIQLAATAHYSYLTATVVKPQLIYLQSRVESTTVYYSYQNNAVNQTNTVTQNDVSKSYPQYFISPNGNSSFWSELRDGKTVFFVGDNNAGNAKQISGLTGYTSYGWYSDDYLLVSKDSTLYIMPVDGPGKAQVPLKISGYFTPATRR